MKTLAKWQIISLISRMVAMGLGIFQSFFIIRILSQGEYGIVQIAVAIGGAFGIYQHLGLSSGSTREISAAKDDNTEIFKIFTTSALIRYTVTVPIAIGLFLSSNYLAFVRYNEPALLIPIRIYAAVLIVQGMQGMMNSVLAGTKQFKKIFIYQAAIAVVSVLLYVPLVYYFRINGFFYALFAFNVIATIVLGTISLRPLRGHMKLITRTDFKRLFKELASISLGIYAVKVIFTMWEKSGPILLGADVSVEQVGVFAFALLYAKKLMHVSDAVTDINLPVFSEKFVHNIAEFKSLFVANFNKVFSFIVFSAMSAIFWSTDLIRLVVGGSKYDESFVLITPMVFTFILYSFINIIKSSVFVPAKLVKEMVFAFVLMLGLTVGTYFVGIKYFAISALLSMTFGLLLGAFICLSYLVLSSQKKLQFSYITKAHILILVQALAMAYTKDVANFWYKVPIYVVFVGLYLWAVLLAKFVVKSDFEFVLKRVGLG